MSGATAQGTQKVELELLGRNRIDHTSIENFLISESDSIIRNNWKEMRE